MTTTRIRTNHETSTMQWTRISSQAVYMYVLCNSNHILSKQPNRLSRLTYCSNSSSSLQERCPDNSANPWCISVVTFIACLFSLSKANSHTILAASCFSASLPSSRIGFRWTKAPVKTDLCSHDLVFISTIKLSWFQAFFPPRYFVVVVALTSYIY